jgi:hypothetical protein
MLKKLIVLTILATGLAALTVGCGSDDPGNNNGVYAGNNGNNGVPDGGSLDAEDGVDDTNVDDATDVTDTTDTADTSDAGNDGGGDTGGDADNDGGDDAGACEPGDCADGEVCLEGTCTTDTATLKCDRAEDIGELALDTPVTVTGSLRDNTDVLTTTCGSASGNEEVFKFTVPETVTVNFDASWLGQYDGVVAFRTNSCETPGSAMDPCFDHESRSFRAEPGNDYYMVVELSNGRAHDFSVELEATEAGCQLGTVSCTNDMLSRCNTDGSTDDYDCADTCAGAGTRCRGDVCGEAVTVTASATFSGDNAAYESTYNFANITGCEVDGTPVGTPGPEVVFFLPGLVTGQTVTVDAQSGDNNNNAIFITSNCGRADQLACLAQDYIDESLVWSVPSDGDYYVFVDKASGAGSTFQYGIDIQ